MIYECSECSVQFWIKLQKVEAETYPSIEKLKRTIDEEQNDNINDFSKNLLTINPESSSYISPIFSLQKLLKNKHNSHFPNQKRLLYHNYAKYKTIPFTYNNLYLPKEYSSSLVQDLSQGIYRSVIEDKKNFCFLSFGSKEAETENLIQGRQGATEGAYYSALIKLFDMVRNFNESTKFHDSSSISYNINFLAFTQTKIIDLLNLKNQIYVSEDPNSSYSQPLIFDNATECSFTSSYELYTTFKRVLFRRKELTSWSVFVIKVNFYTSQTSENKELLNSALLIEWVKQSQNFMTLANQRGHQRNKSSFGEKSLLCLNQCILEIYKQIQIRSQQKTKHQKPTQKLSENLYQEEEILKLSNLPCFRNSLITRILKPYLLFNTQFVIMTLCSINQEHQNDSYQSLMLGKHLSKLHSLVILNSFQPPKTQSEKEDQQNQIDEEQNLNMNPQNQSLRKQQTIDSAKYSPSKKSHTKNASSFHESLSNSPNKKAKSIKESTSHQDLFSNNPPNKQGKVREKLLALLEESKQKQQLADSDKKEFNQISKKIFEEKSKSLRAKKQLNMLKIKANTKNLKAKITQKLESDTQLIEQQIKRLNFDEKKLQKELSELKDTIESKLVQAELQKTQQGSPIDKQKAKIQKIRMLRSHLKNQLEMTQMQINEFLEQKESIKSIFLHEINLLGHHERQLIKKLEMEKNKHYREELTNSRERKSLPKVRLTKEMEPFYKNSLASKVKVNLSLNRENVGASYFADKSKQTDNRNRYKTESSQKNKLEKSFSLKKKEAYESLDAIQVQKLKQERLLIRKRSELKQKINRGKGQYMKFLQDTANKYLDYNPKRRQSTK